MWGILSFIRAQGPGGAHDEFVFDFLRFSPPPLRRMFQLFMLASLVTTAAAQTISYSGCGGSSTCTTSSTPPASGCAVYVSNLPLTSVCTAGVANLGFYFSAVPGSIPSTVNVSTYQNAACTGTAGNINSNLPLTGVAGCQPAACVGAAVGRA